MLIYVYSTPLSAEVFEKGLKIVYHDGAHRQYTGLNRLIKKNVKNSDNT